MYLGQIIKYKNEKWEVIELRYDKGQLMFIKLRDTNTIHGKEIITTPDNLKNDN